MQKDTKQNTIAKLLRTSEEAERLRQKGRASLDFKSWYQSSQNAITAIFGDQSRQLREFKNIPFSLGYYHDETPDSDFEDAFQRGITNAVSLLKSMSEEVAEYWEDEELGTTERRGPNVLPSNQRQASPNKLFIVHGHNHGLKEEVARFVSNLGIRPIILHEQPNQGRTIIEKFEDHSLDVSYAIGLFTADDVGASVKTPENLRPRARQNVVLEFGYFIAKLGRDRVCGLVEDGVDIPSDYSGVLYVNIDVASYWRVLLARELRSAGFAFDANLAL